MSAWRDLQSWPMLPGQAAAISFLAGLSGHVTALHATADVDGAPVEVILVGERREALEELASRLEVEL